MKKSNELGSSFLSDSDVIAVRAGFQLDLNNLAAPLAIAGHRILDQISTPNWKLEWFLPRWLGNSFGLSPDVIQRLILGNVLGLAFTRLVDDFVDDEDQVADPVTTICLATLLYHLAIKRYRELININPRFWDEVDEYLAQWANAIYVSNRSPERGYRSLRQNNFRSLAQLGAPLKICCVAICSLSNQELAMHDLLLSIDHYVISAILLDHFKDWQDDVRANRYNLFVDHITLGLEELRTGEGLRQHVLQAILNSEELSQYFTMILKHAQVAKLYASKVPCIELEQHLNSFHQQVFVYGDRLNEGIENVLLRAGQQFFGHTLPSSPNSISN